MTTKAPNMKSPDTGTGAEAGRERWWAAEPSDVAGHVRIRARIAGLHCSLCTGTIDKGLGRLPGVDKVAVSLTHEQTLVDYDPDRITPDRILGTLQDLGYQLYDPRKLRRFEDEEADLVREGLRLLTAIAASLTAIGLIAQLAGVWSVLVPASVVAVMVPVGYAILRPAGPLRAAAGAVGIIAPGLAAIAARVTGVLGEPVTGWLAGGLAAGVVAAVAPHIARMAAAAVRRRILNQHVLLEVGAFAGIAGGVIGLTGVLPGYPTAAFFAVTVLVTNYHIFSEWLSLLVKTRSGQAVKKLLDLQPDTACVVRDGVEWQVAVEDVAAGELVRVRPGERIPLDGAVRDGHSAVDVSVVTGEPVPVERAAGDEVIGGSVNTTGSLLVEVTRTGAESFLAQVTRQVEDARALKPGILHLVDRVLRVYTPTVLAVSALALIGWLAGSWAAAGEPDVRRAVFAALTVLVMGYPCAVGIAAPLAIVRGAGQAADAGILMRTGEAFQTLRLVRYMVLDKTGTLTQGTPTVRAVHALDGDDDRLLALAASAEAHSEHPLGHAIVAAAAQLHLPTAEPGEFTSITGAGVRADVDGRQVLIGKPDLLAERGIEPGPLAEAADRWRRAGDTVVAVAADGQPLGLIALGDQIRPEAGEMLAELRRLRIEPVLVTGDDPAAAAHVAARLGIERVHGGVLPGGKADIIRSLQDSLQGGVRVAMAGDGINDAPALMQADVGIAMGHGTDIAIESADIIALHEDLRTVTAAHAISGTAYRRVKQNVALAFAFNGIGIPAAATGLIYPVWAMIAMAASVTAIFLNSIGARPRLLVAAIASVGRRPATEQKPH
ncbi:heavy metal translocating P-type ATPase [Actinomadura sediminis]|uniref:Heavy metal translocating P-type ATPase n=1 Tax=Actinomadura sediminis TaxID=1038904 RepID=A0ABW3EIN7_9ACTN